MADHAGNAQAAMGNGAVAQVMTGVEVGVGHDGTASHLIECDVFCRQVGGTGHHHRVAHALGVLQGPAQGLHATETAAHHRRQLLYAQLIQQPGLGVDPVLHRHHRKVRTPGLAGGRVGVGRAGGTEAGANVVHADHEKPVGVQRLAGPDHVVPPALAAGDGLALRIRVHTGHMVRCVQGMADQHGIAALRIELSVGFVHQLVAGQLGTALQGQRLGESVGLR